MHVVIGDFVDYIGDFRTKNSLTLINVSKYKKQPSHTQGIIQLLTKYTKGIFFFLKKDIQFPLLPALGTL